jgi:hypothetical protein
MTHASVPDDRRLELGITDNLIRLSVGLESAEDLVEDLDQALKASQQVWAPPLPFITSLNQQIFIIIWGSNLPLANPLGRFPFLCL